MALGTAGLPEADRQKGEDSVMIANAKKDKKERRYSGFWSLVSFVDNMLSQPKGVLLFIGICILDACIKLCIRYYSIEQSDCVFFVATVYYNLEATALALLIAATTGHAIKYKE